MCWELQKCSSLGVYPLVVNGLGFVFKGIVKAHLLAIHLDSDKDRFISSNSLSMLVVSSL